MQGAGRWARCDDRHGGTSMKRHSSTASLSAYVTHNQTQVPVCAKEAADAPLPPPLFDAYNNTKNLRSIVHRCACFNARYISGQFRLKISYFLFQRCPVFSSPLPPPPPSTDERRRRLRITFLTNFHLYRGFFISGDQLPLLEQIFSRSWIQISYLSEQKFIQK